jgi:hypothetical protein
VGGEVFQDADSVRNGVMFARALRHYPGAKDNHPGMQRSLNYQPLLTDITTGAAKAKARRWGGDALN